MLIYLSLIETEEDKSKFEIIYQEYKKLMFSCAYKILNNERDAEDAVHDSFIKIINHLDKIIVPKCPKTKAFVVIVCENTAKDQLKAKTKKPQHELVETMGRNEPRIENLSDSNSIATAIAALPDNYRNFMLLKYDFGLTEKEIAKLLSISFENVKKTIYRAKTKLKHILEDMEVKV